MYHIEFSFWQYMIYGNILRDYGERVHHREVCAPDSENSSCATLCGHLSNG